MINITKMNAEIVNLLCQHKSIKEISCLLNITEKQVYTRIKQIINYGYNLKPEYLSNSDIYYTLDNRYNVKKDNSVRINLLDNYQFRCIVISDTHIGNEKFEFDYLKRVYDYAARNGHHIILNCGDVIEGTHTSDKKKLKDIESQVNALVKRHPYDKNINVFTILGNHDIHSLHFDGLDISKIITNSRYDIIPIGYGKGVVNIAKDSLLLKHELSVTKNPEIEDNSKLTIVGHGHMMKTKIYKDAMYLCAPTLSKVSPDKTKTVLPGFIDLRIEIEKGKFDYIEARHFILNPRECEISQSRCKIKELYK